MELVSVKNLKKYFPLKRGLVSQTGLVKAVDGIDFDIKTGKTLGLVGESGSGKTTVGRLILRLIEPTEGKIYFEGKDLTTLSNSQLRILRRKMQLVFQDPYSSLSPRYKIGKIIEEPLIIHKLGSKKQREKRVEQLLELVGLEPNFKNKYPHEFSGGQRQRIGICRALASSPSFIVADEPVSSLDVSVQAQIINLFLELQEKFNLTYLFISHDLSVVRHISDGVAIMYSGQIVEMGETEEIYHHPLHPYTMLLLESTSFRKSESYSDANSHLILGCSFYPRCHQKKEKCRTNRPELKKIDARRKIRCFLY
ncbi:MAG: ABC transporter ATP-binding protein [Candidatus Aminicenantia bacterium]